MCLNWTVNYPSQQQILGQSHDAFSKEEETYTNTNRHSTISPDISDKKHTPSHTFIWKRDKIWQLLLKLVICGIKEESEKMKMEIQDLMLEASATEVLDGI